MLYNQTITKQVVKEAEKALLKERDLPEGGLKYLGFTDCTILQDGWYQLCFNVTITNHHTELFGGTMPFNFGKVGE